MYGMYSISLSTYYIVWSEGSVNPYCRVYKPSNENVVVVIFFLFKQRRKISWCVVFNHKGFVFSPFLGRYHFLAYPRGTHYWHSHSGECIFYNTWIILLLYFYILINFYIIYVLNILIYNFFNWRFFLHSDFYLPSSSPDLSIASIPQIFFICLDKHAPLISKTIFPGPCIPWFNADLLYSKQEMCTA